jgi:hypothetical protein
MKALDEQAGVAWLESQLRFSTESALSPGSWILDTDTTVKCFYGKQEGAAMSYNPTKPRHPSHNYHSCFMGNTRPALTVKVNHGNQYTCNHVMPSLWCYYDSFTTEKSPAVFWRDIFLGNEGFLSEAELCNARYLTKFRLNANVKRLIERLFLGAD